MLRASLDYFKFQGCERLEHVGNGGGTEDGGGANRGIMVIIRNLISRLKRFSGVFRGGGTV